MAKLFNFLNMHVQNCIKIFYNLYGIRRHLRQPPFAKVVKYPQNTLKLSSDTTKPTKWLCAQRRLRSVWASAQSDQSLRRIKEAWILSYTLRAQRRLWSDWADAQTDLSLCWAHTHFVVFFSCRGSNCLEYAMLISRFNIWGLASTFR